MNKFELVKDALVKIGNDNKNRTSLLDVGCRDCVLKRYLSPNIDYHGMDLFQNADNSVEHVADFSNGVQFEDRSFSVVVALDLVEHLDDFHTGMKELFRLADKTLILMLPNMAHAFFRWEFLKSGRLTDKYDLSYGMGQDRHRWLTTIPQIDNYVSAFANANGARYQVIRIVDTKKKRIFARAARLFGLGPEWWAWASFYVIHKDSNS